MKEKQLLRAIKKIAKLSIKLTKLREKMNESYFFEDLLSWGCTDIYKHCSIKDGVLYDNKGRELSNDGNCMTESIPYFVNQSTGYCGDDYYGTMFVKVDNKNTFIAIHYEC